jgi:hypothetical protein
MIQALEKNLGHVTDACKQVRISRYTHYEWIKNDPEYAEQTENIDEQIIEIAEKSLYKQILKGNMTAICFFLKTRAKHKGYIERVQNVNLNTDIATGGYAEFMKAFELVENGETNTKRPRTNL